MDIGAIGGVYLTNTRKPVDNPEVMIKKPGQIKKHQDIVSYETNPARTIPASYELGKIRNRTSIHNKTFDPKKGTLVDQKR